MKRVFVNGYGSIGSRISQFIAEDSEIDVIGVGKYSPDEKVNQAISRGFAVYVPESKKMRLLIIKFLEQLKKHYLIAI